MSGHKCAEALIRLERVGSKGRRGLRSQGRKVDLVLRLGDLELQNTERRMRILAQESSGTKRT
jgi:hypothetical protein